MQKAGLYSMKSTKRDCAAAVQIMLDYLKETAKGQSHP
jgi:hypothetical protein